MSAVLIISIFLLGLATYAFLRSKRSGSTEESSGHLAPPPSPRALFDVPEAGPRPLADADDARRVLIERALGGDVGAWRETHAGGDAALYSDVLDALVSPGAGLGPEALLLLGREIISGDGLRANRALARALLRNWRASPSRVTLSATADLVRVAALSDDAETFRETIETVYRAWREGELRVASPEELAALFENEHWILSPDARRSGAGFVLKRTLAELRRALSDDARRETPTVR